MQLIERKGKGVILAATLGFMVAAHAAATPNIEDLPIDAGTSPTAKPAPAVTPATPAGPANTASANGSEMILVPRAVWEKLLKDVEELKGRNGAPGSTEVPPPLETGPSKPETGAATGTGGTRNYLLLPDISFQMQAKGLASTDKRAEDRGKLGTAEGELGIQGYVYPGVKADAFIVGAPAEDEPFQIEEGYLTFLGVRKGLNINVGKKFVPFGRTGELHNHSWLYPRQLLPLQNLVSEEALVGQGVNLNYLLPLKGKVFARASFGVFNGEGTDTQVNVTDPSDPFFGGLPTGTAAGFNDRFYNARLWTGTSVGKNDEVELGLSHAWGDSTINSDDTAGISSNGRVKLYGADASYRHYMGANKRVLLRSEYFKYKPSGGLLTNDASGYYGLANYRWDKYNDAGLLFERSGFPQAPGVHEDAASLIYTRQFTEQFYMRLMGTHGRRAGDSYNEVRLQFTAGIGPHTHNLE
jgi:hypothetical protein